MCVDIQQRGKKNKWLARAAAVEEELWENNGTATAAVPAVRPSVLSSLRGSSQYMNTPKGETGKTPGVPSTCKSNVFVPKAWPFIYRVDGFRWNLQTCHPASSWQHPGTRCGQLVCRRNASYAGLQLSLQSRGPCPTSSASTAAWKI